MRIAVSGASGLLGSALVPGLLGDGHDVVRLVRGQASAPDEVTWDPAHGTLGAAVLRDVDAVINLSGAPVAARRWSPKQKQLILDSRVEATTTLALALAAAEPRPRLLLSASAIGWYGDTGDVAVDETKPAGSGYFPSVVRSWEGATQPAEQAGVRVLHLRTGLVLTGTGGLLGSGVALPGGLKLPLLTLFKLGAGGRLAGGRQWQSWISLADEVGAIRFLLAEAEAMDLRGAVNLTGPEPVRNALLTRALGKAVHRPAVLPVPKVALRLAIGEFANEAVASQRVLPRVLLDAGYEFQHRTVDQAVDSALHPG
ncbi:MAG: uncharacterized protein QOI76_973 [Frankiales bacterium]|nr:uncharacterized protein [Frankiales bacterium]